MVEAWPRTNKKIEQTLGIAIRKPESKLSAIPKTIMLIYLKREVTSEGKCIGVIKYDTYCVVRYVCGDARSYTEAETAQFTTIDRLGPRPVELLAS